MEKTEKKTKRQLSGWVVSNKADKTIVVKVDRKKMHPTYPKFIVSSRKYHVHDEKNIAQVGDAVIIIESRPISKLKKWQLLNIKQKSV